MVLVLVLMQVLASDADAEAPEGDDMVLKMRGMQQELTTLKRNYGRR